MTRICLPCISHCQNEARIRRAGGLLVVQNQIKVLAKDNSGKLAAIFVEAGLYCSAFHHVKENAKRATRDRK